MAPGQSSLAHLEDERRRGATLAQGTRRAGRQAGYGTRRSANKLRAVSQGDRDKRRCLGHQRTALLTQPPLVRRLSPIPPCAPTVAHERQAMDSADAAARLSARLTDQTGEFGCTAPDTASGMPTSISQKATRGAGTGRMRPYADDEAVKVLLELLR